MSSDPLSPPDNPAITAIPAEDRLARAEHIEDIAFRLTNAAHRQALLDFAAELRATAGLAHDVEKPVH